MYIQNKLLSALYKLLLGIISLVGFWATLSLFGAAAWRLFSTWALLLGAIYFCLAALILALSRKRTAGESPCAMLEGMLVVAFVIQGVASIACLMRDDYAPGLQGFMAILAYYVLPILALLDWGLFNKKGQWRPIDPFYWLAFPLAYVAMIILTANLLPSSTTLRYPLAFLDYNAHGLPEMFEWLGLLGLLILIFGYILVVADAFMGGIVAKHIVLPHIRAVTDEEDSSTEEDAPTSPKDAPRATIEEAELTADLTEAEEDDAEATKTVKRETEADDLGTEAIDLEVEEIEIVEPDEIIIEQPKTEKSAPASAEPKRSRRAAPKPPKSAAPRSQKSKATTPRGRKIDDIMRSQKSNSGKTSTPRTGQPASSVHKKHTH